MSHMIKFNSVKTEFVMSGASHHINPFVYINSLRIYPQSSLTHLGFHWSINNQNNNASFSISQVNNRIKEMWCAVNALITTGIRFCHPQTIFTLYKTIVIPKLLYGLELCQLNATTKFQGSKISIKTCGPVGLVDLLIYRPDNEVNKSDKFPPNFNFLYLQQHLNKNQSCLWPMGFSCFFFVAILRVFIRDMQDYPARNA